MKNHTNIYDIDGNLIREIDDTHGWTAEDARKQIKYYQEKLDELKSKENPTPEDIKKIEIYSVYCKNLSKFEFQKILEMDQNSMTDYVSKNIAIHTTKEQVEEALNDLKDDLETEENIGNEVPNTSSSNSRSASNEELGDDEVVERSDSDIHEERSLSQSDLLVERDNVSTNMDEYVDYE